MSRQPSEATQLRSLKAENKVLRSQVTRLQVEIQMSRGRATVAEKETAEWKRRFDLLLERTPKEPKP